MRQAARALLLDPRDRLLLLQAADPTRPERGRFWFTVGGGLEGGEAPEQALRREVAEEVGIRDLQVGPAVWLLRNRFRFMDRTIDQENTFYLVRASAVTIDRSGQDAGERAIIAGTRWWTLDELRTTSDRLYPGSLVEGLETLLRDGPPTSPLRLPDE